MMSNSSDSINIVNLVKSCLNTNEAISIVDIYEFKNDSEAHDDKFQEQLNDKFIRLFNMSVKYLDIEFGFRIEMDQYKIESIIPLTGIIKSAIWKIGNKQVYLALSHEDREMPYILATGIIDILF
jgi:hypothetical protein